MFHSWCFGLNVGSLRNTSNHYDPTVHFFLNSKRHLTHPNGGGDWPYFLPILANNWLHEEHWTFSQTLKAFILEQVGTLLVMELQNWLYVPAASTVFQARSLVDGEVFLNILIISRTKWKHLNNVHICSIIWIDAFGICSGLETAPTHYLNYNVRCQILNLYIWLSHCFEDWSKCCKIRAFYADKETNSSRKPRSATVS